MASCPECGQELGRASRCRECGWTRPGATSTSAGKGERRTDPRCDWLMRGARCLMRGTVLYGAEGHESRYCTWHDEARRQPRLAEQAEEFARWCLTLRARGYCGTKNLWTHAPPGWLFQLVTGDESAALEPPRQVGCANTGCPYGWNGERVTGATDASTATPLAAARPAWITGGAAT